jgi:hypothetical protein
MDTGEFSEKSNYEKFMSGEIGEWDELVASPMPSTPTESSESPSWSSSDDSHSLSSGDQQNKVGGKQVFVNEMPVGAEDGRHGVFSRLMSALGIYHTNVSVESDGGSKTTSGMGRDKSGGSSGDMPIGMPTKSMDQTKRNEDEAEQHNLTKVPLDQYMGGKYKNADPDKLEADLQKENDEGTPTGTYGVLKETEEGLIRPNICWSHSNERLFRALPKEEQDKMRETNREYYDGLKDAIRKPSGEDGYLD